VKLEAIVWFRVTLNNEGFAVPLMQERRRHFCSDSQTTTTGADRGGIIPTSVMRTLIETTHEGDKTGLGKMDRLKSKLINSQDSPSKRDIVEGGRASKDFNKGFFLKGKRGRV